MTSECCSNHVSDSNGNVMVFSLSSFITKFLSFFVYNYFLLAARIRNGFLAQNFSLSHHFFSRAMCQNLLSCTLQCTFRFRHHIMIG
jgi:hypothetical protein